MVFLTEDQLVFYRSAYWAQGAALRSECTLTFITIKPENSDLSFNFSSIRIPAY